METKPIQQAIREIAGTLRVHRDHLTEQINQLERLSEAIEAKAATLEVSEREAD